MVYLLHFERPLAHAQHYIGWAKDKRTMNAWRHCLICRAAKGWKVER